MLQKNKATLTNYDEAKQLEWLETNGLGGWASSSIIGCNTRRYHGLLVAATKPPTGRMVMVSKIDEKIIYNGQVAELGTNNFGDAINPAGYHFLAQFTKDLFPEWVYEVNGITLKKTIAMVHGENTTLIVYTAVKAAKAFTLQLQPFIAARDYHQLQNNESGLWWDVDFENGIFKNQPFAHSPFVYISVPGSTYEHEPNWFNHFNYDEEKGRGLDYKEDLLNHGTISVTLKKGQSIGIIVSTENPAGKDAFALLEKETALRKALLHKQPENETIKQLLLAADQFIVQRGDNLKTVIAGYHWFTDWGRDTMISLPGLCLCTGRFDDAKKIIAAFANSVSEGMLPNRFQDHDEPPQYNNVDGTLWFFIAVYKYLAATKDTAFVFEEILPMLADIMDWHFKGTRYQIHATADGLLYAGEQGQQLTWMDAKIADWVVTPRMGKPVEVQALWYNALRIYSELLHSSHQMEAAAHFAAQATLAKVSFKKLFWYAEGKYLYDVIDKNNVPDTSLRPNQLFAICLPFPLLEGEDAKAVLKIVEEKLYTPIGLRTLPTSDLRYVGVYAGSVIKRDSCYHQGTAWSWLLGAYIDALIKVRGTKGKAQAKEVVKEFTYHLEEGCIGSVSEIFDADIPHQPKGCIAQAWGVAEWLRVMKEYKLY
ncbi:amylo-alpha-1,6-glucosidase [Parasediminibacterium sp. JCM 36343]|uniref:amylo-alpha-1,6-glucosidase n=1 Tax=Parasediminibacterium sp. JCM 36343 TaxID=3374279 RepID=UPI00397BE445